MKKQLAMLKDLLHWIVFAIVFFALYIFVHISLTNIISGDATILEYIFIFGILLLTLISIIKEYRVRILDSIRASIRTASPIIAGGFIWWIVYMGDIPDVPDWFFEMCLYLFIGYVIIGVPIQLFVLSKKAKEEEKRKERRRKYKKIEKDRKRYKEKISKSVINGGTK
jgi:hypothetical protein